MRELVIVSSALAFSLCTVFRQKIDDGLPRTAGVLTEFFRTWFRQRPNEAESLRFVSRLAGALRAGQSLDSALEAIAGEAGNPARSRASAVLRGQPGTDPLNIFVAGAVRTGLPALAGLQAFVGIFRAEQRARRKSRAATAQSRAQAETLSWLPWVLALALVALDPEWATQAAKNPASWISCAGALALTGSGRAWMRRMLARALAPADYRERLEEEVLPTILMELIARLANGEDAETAYERSVAGRLRSGGELPQLKILVDRAARSGAPLREELLAMLGDVHQQIESRWEERTQRLPVQMMAPLFLCFFPSSLLVIASLIHPMFGELR